MLRKIQSWSVVSIWLLSVIHADDFVTRTCIKPKCFIYEERNASIEVKVGRLNNGRDSPVTTFCFKGVPESLLRLWVNPVLHISRKTTSSNESSKFVFYFGKSVSDVNERSQKPGYRMLQELASKLHPLKQTADLSLDPFNLSCLIIDTDVEYKASVRIKAADFWYVIYLIVGIIIFFSARSWCHNTSLHYGTGVSVGILLSILVLVFILTKFLPSRLKNIGYILMLFGGSVSLWLLTSVGNFFSDPVTNTLVEYWQYVLSYIVIAGIISFGLVYRYGPVTDGRSLSLIQWFLQLVGLVLVYNSTQIREVSIALVLILLTTYNFPRNIFVNRRSKNLWYKFFPPKIKLLTEDEYIMQGNIETRKELEKLREYCRSPDCQAWKIISRLKSPHRFAEFVEGNSWHVTDEELLDYDSGPDPPPPHLISDDDEFDIEEEMDFILSSP